MKMKVRSIHGHGKAAEEYVILDVLQNCNAQYYLIADTTYTGENQISNKYRHTHRFSQADLKAGDVIVLYTREGTSSTKKNANGSTTYYRYWNLKTAVWNDDGDGAILFEISSWNTTKVSSTK